MFKDPGNFIIELNSNGSALAVLFDEGHTSYLEVNV